MLRLSEYHIAHGHRIRVDNFFEVCMKLKVVLGLSSTGKYDSLALRWGSHWL
jgi:hypothetical protein